MFPFKNTPITLTTPLSISIVSKYETFFKNLHERLVNVTIDKKIFKDVKLENIGRLLWENNVYAKNYVAVKDVNIAINDNSIIKKDSCKNLNIDFKKTTIWTNTNKISTEEISSVELELPVGTEFYISYIKFSERFSVNTYTKINILKCPEKILRNKTIIVDNNFLNNFILK